MLKKYLPYLPAILPWALLVALFAPVFHLLYIERWDMVDYGHAPFILPISLFITWTKRKVLAEIAQRAINKFYLPGFLLLAFSAFLFTFGWRWDYLLIQVISLIPFIIGMLSFFYGPAIIRPLAFPITYILLLVPPPIGILDSITVPMRQFASISAEIVLKTFNYPVTRQGLLLHLGGHEIFLGAPCSGFRSLITMFSLGLVYVYFNKGDMKKNIVLILSIVPLAIFGNVVRVLIISLLTYYYGSEVGQGFLHETSGVVVFLIMLAGLMIIERCMRGKKK